MSTLYELTGQFLNIYEMSSDDEVFLDTLESIDWENDFEAKVENYGKVIAELNADEANLTTEIKRLTEKREAVRNKVSSLKETLKMAMETVDKPKVKTPLFNFRIQKNPASVKITDETVIEEKYFKIKREVDKAKIKEIIKSGGYIDGAELIQTESLRIS